MKIALALLGLALAAPVVLAADSAAPAATPLSTQPTEAECAELGRTLAGLIAEGKADDVIALLDRPALAGRTVEGLGLDEAGARDFRAGLLQNVPAALKREYASMTAAHFVRVQTVGADRRALLRLLQQDGGASYIAFVGIRRPGEAVKWCDAFSYTGGETISQSARRTVLPFLQEAKKNSLQKLIGSDSAVVTYYATITSATRLFQNGKPVEAWTACEKLPAEVQKDRTVLVLRLRIAQALDEAKYLRVINEWKAAFPSDPTLDFISIDGDLLRKDYAAALGHVESFARQIGGDAYLDFLAANVLMLAERYDEARKRARLALADNSGVNDAYDTLLTISLKSKNFAETAAVLTELRTRFPALDLSAVAGSEEYAEFRLSRAYREWVAQNKTPVAK